MSTKIAGHGVKVVEFAGKWFTLHKIPYQNNSSSAVTFDVDQSCTKVSVVVPDSGGPTPTLGSASSGLKTISLAAGGSSTDSHVWVVCTHGSRIASGNRG